MPSSGADTTLLLHLPPKIAVVARATIEKLGCQALMIRRPTEAIKVMRQRQVALFLFRIQNPAKDCALFQKIRRSHPRCAGIAFLSPRLRGEFPLFRADAYPDHLIPDKTRMEYADMETTIRKVLSRDIFGMEKYGIRPRESLQLVSSSQKEAMVRKIASYFKRRGAPGRAIRNMILILHELIMNSIFDAPINRLGNKVYYARARSSPIRLAPKQRPEISYGMSKDAIAVSVADPFGAFNKATFFAIMNRLRTQRSLKRGSGRGAGVGLFMTFRALDEMIVNVDPGRRTEFIALLYLRKRSGDGPRHQKKGRALHFFQGGAHGGT